MARIIQANAVMDDGRKPNSTPDCIKPNFAGLGLSLGIVLMVIVSRAGASLPMENLSYAQCPVTRITKQSIARISKWGIALTVADAVFYIRGMMVVM